MNRLRVEGRRAGLPLEARLDRGVDTVVLENELALYEILPVQWQDLPQTPDALVRGRREDANLLLLRTCIAVEDHPVREKHEEQNPLAAEFARLDLKLDLVLKLLSVVVDGGHALAPVPIRFNSKGASWQTAGAMPTRGSCGLLGIRLLGFLPQNLELHSEITESEGDSVTARFLEPTPGVVDLIQQLCFLKHRKQVADARKSRMG